MSFKMCLVIILSLTACMANLTAEADLSNLSQKVTFQNQAQAQKDIQNQTQQAKEEVQKSLVPDAIFIVNETKKAINFIKNGQMAEALSAVENATGKSDVLLARHPENALLPVDFAIKVIDSAPVELNKINGIEKLIKKNIDYKNYPVSRALLNFLCSEIDVVTYCLPLAYYPEALKKAARLLELKQASEASLVLDIALNTLVEMHQTFPIPTIKVITLLTTAEDILEKENDKENALKLVNEAKFELKRSIELGYLEKDEKYRALNEELTDLENKINKNQKSTSSFRSLKEKFRDFLKILSKPKSASRCLNE